MRLMEGGMKRRVCRTMIGIRLCREVGFFSHYGHLFRLHTLSSYVEILLLKLGEEFRKQESKHRSPLRLVFLINNYDLILGAIEVSFNQFKDIRHFFVRFFL